MSAPVDVLAKMDRTIAACEGGRDEHGSVGNATLAMLYQRLVDEERSVRAAFAELIEAAQEVIDGTVSASTYPDGPCIETADRNRLIAALARVSGGAA